MSNLFSVFDPTSLWGFSLNWLAPLRALFLIPSKFWTASSQPHSALSSIVEYVNKEFQAITGPNISPGSLVLPLSLFIFILINNFLGLFPYIFTAPRHLVFTLSFALPLWLGHMAFAWLKSTSTILAHLVPSGTPGPLMPFMVIIEIVRRLIRPLTLSVRLAANMVAGHLLLTLLGSLGPGLPLSLTLGLVITLILLLMLEAAVALIQAYVFSILSTLYLNEVNSINLNN